MRCRIRRARSINTHHGLTNAVFMPYVLDFNRQALGTRSTGSRRGSGIEAASTVSSTYHAASAANWHPAYPRQIGVDDTRFEEMAEMAAVDPTAGGNPRHLSAADALDLYQRATEGRLG